jgi:hypothetical protein
VRLWLYWFLVLLEQTAPPHICLLFHSIYFLYRSPPTSAPLPLREFKPLFDALSFFNLCAHPPKTTFSYRIFIVCYYNKSSAMRIILIAKIYSLSGLYGGKQTFKVDNFLPPLQISSDLYNTVLVWTRRDSSCGLGYLEVGLD